ncbi:MAG: hypothetical protein J6J42_03540 [Lachnospiraceae bacterium]|nr:hypothetical protein [Lachnospiraceae bacterium]
MASDSKKSFSTVNKKYLLSVVILLAGIIKVVLVQNLPIYAITYAVHDDRMMVNMAQSLLAGEWLGEYNQMTLVKGIVYPLFLAFCNKIGMPYLTGIALNYFFACMLMIFVISKVYKNKIGLFFIYIILLFDPITMSLHAFQRVYRCSLTPAHIIILLACFFAMYIERKQSKKKMIAWAVLAGVSLGIMWNTREDGIWVLPFVAGVIFVTVLKVFFEFKKKDRFIRIGIGVLPLVVFLIMNNAIALTNYIHYGIYTTNELSDSAYSDFMKSIYSVRPNDDIDYVSVPRETMNRICEESPTLKSIQENINITLDAWEIHGKTTGDMEVEHGRLFWALRDAVAASGYYADAQKANNFYMTVSNEIEQAIEEGRLERRNIMPSVMMAPWKSEFFSELLTQLPKTLKSVIEYAGVAASIEQSVDNDIENKGIRLYESLTGNLAIYPTRYVTSINGWMFAKNEDWKAVNIVDRNYNKISEINFMESPDIYDYFIYEFNLSYENANQCRFAISLSELEQSRFPLQVEIISSTGEKQYYELVTTENEDLIMLYDNVSTAESEDIYASYSEKRVDLINRFSSIYKKVNPVLFVIGVIGYVYITVMYVISVRKKENICEEMWLFLSGVLGSLVVLVGGISYTHISAYNAVTHLYLSAAYPLNTLFGIVSVVTVYSMLKKRIRIQLMTEDKKNEV